MENTEITEFLNDESIPVEADGQSCELRPDEADAEADLTSEDPNDTAEDTDATEALRQELSALKAYVAEKEAAEAKATSELEEFKRLYPDTELESIDSDVWQRVSEGLPLSAAFAVTQREKELQKSLAEQINLRNSATAAGSAGIPPKLDYFSPDEVRAMSGEEVRQNYSNIRRSMSYWQRAKK